MQKLSAFIFILLIMIAHQVLGNVDSLRIEYRLAKSDTAKIRLLTEIGDHFEAALPDSALKYYNMGVDVAANSKIKDVKLFEQKGLLLRYIGIIYRNKGESFTALEYYQQALEIFLEHNITKGISATYNNFGVAYRNLGNYPKAAEYYHKALEIFEQQEDYVWMASCYNNLGIIYDILADYPKALEYYFQASELFEQENRLVSLGSTLMNIGTVYVSQREDDLALDYLQRSLDYMTQFNRLPSITRILQNMSVIHLYAKRFDEAFKLLDQALEIAISMNDSKSQSVIYRNKAEIHLYNANYSESQRFARKALDIATEIKALDDQVKAYSTLYKATWQAGNLSDAMQYADQFIHLNDSLHNIEKSSAILELEARYQNEKKQKEIETLHQNQEMQRLQLVENQAEIQLQKFIIILIAFILLVSVGFVFLKLKQLRIIRESNNKLEKQNQEIQRKNKEISKQRNKIHQQRNIVLEQKNQIEGQNKALSLANMQIISGIRYAERIQSALFPDTAYLNKHLGESFIFFKPKDIVSGDFYWLLPKNGKTLIAAADCTGHGVAGSLLSMLGIAFLNESMHNQNLNSSGEYLDFLTKRFDESLLVSEEGRQTREGMEISFCIFDKKNSTVEFSGADSSICIVRDNKIEHIKGDRRPIGQTANHENGFSNIRLNLREGDMIYIYSDGYINQFGGPNGNRYTSSGFFKLLENISQHNLSYQKLLLEREFDQWKGNKHPQIDDVLVLGFRV